MYCIIIVLYRNQKPSVVKNPVELPVFYILHKFHALSFKNTQHMLNCFIYVGLACSTNSGAIIGLRVFYVPIQTDTASGDKSDDSLLKGILSNW